MVASVGVMVLKKSGPSCLFICEAAPLHLTSLSDRATSTSTSSKRRTLHGALLWAGVAGAEQAQEMLANNLPPCEYMPTRWFLSFTTSSPDHTYHIATCLATACSKDPEKPVTTVPSLTSTNNCCIR